MNKEQILKNIEDEVQRKNVETILNYAESVAKSGEMTAEQFAEKFATEAEKMQIEVDKVDGLQAQLDKMGVEIDAMKEKGGKAEVKSLTEIVKEAINELKNVGSNGKFGLKIPISSVNKTTVAMSSITDDYGGLRLPGIGQIQTPRNRILPILNTFPIGADSHGTVYYTDQTTRTNNAAARAMGAAAGESAITWTGFTKPLESISDSIPVHKEVLSRVSLMEAELRNFITENLTQKLDGYAFSGTGTTPQIDGIYTGADTFDSAAYSGFKPQKAALLDLIVIMATEVMKETKYDVNYAVINPSDALGLQLEKDENGNRINFQMTNPMTGETVVKGIKIIESSKVTANTLLVGDFRMARMYMGDNINIEFGYNTSGDFTKRIVTMLGNMEALMLVRNCEADAFLKSTNISADIANINSNVVTD